MASGGYRKPSAPAPASGPGRLSRRTDGGPGQKLRTAPSASYGEAQELTDLQREAPLALTDGALSPSQGGSGAPVEVIPFGAPTMVPGQPVTAGAPMGAGPGPDALGITPDAVFSEDRRQLLRYLPVLEYIANGPNALPSMRALVRRIKATAGV